jgi:hypothetical protein
VIRRKRRQAQVSTAAAISELQCSVASPPQLAGTVLSWGLTVLTSFPVLNFGMSAPDMGLCKCVQWDNNTSVWTTADCTGILDTGAEPEGASFDLEFDNALLVSPIAGGTQTLLLIPPNWGFFGSLVGDKNPILVNPAAIGGAVPWIVAFHSDVM